MPSDIGVKFEATGEASLQSAIKAVSAEMKALDAGVKAATEQMKGMGDSEEATQKRNELLNKSIEAGNQKLELLSKQYSAATKELERLAQNLDKARESNDPVAIEKAEKAYYKQQETVSKLSAEMSKTEQAISSSNNALQQAETQTEQTESATESFKDKIADLAKQMDVGFAKEAIGSAISGMEKFAGKCIDVAKSLWGMASDASTMADDMLTLATQTGLSTTQLQEWGYASRFVDTEVSTLTGSMSKLLKNMTSSSKDVSAAFDTLGVKTRDSNGALRDQETVMWECIDALGKVKNETERDSLAMTIFGKSAKELNPLIEAGSDAWNDYCKEAREAGLVLSEDGMNALGGFNDGLQRIEATMDAARNQIMAALAPAFEKIANLVADAAQQFTKWIQTDEAQMYLSELTTVIASLASSLGQNLGPMIQKAIELFQNIGGAIQFASEHADAIATAIKAFVTVLGTLKVAMAGLQIAQIFSNPLSAAVAIIAGVSAAVVALAKACGVSMDDVKKAFSNAWNAIKSAWSGVTSFFSSIWNGIKSAFSSVQSTLSGFFSGAWNAIKSTWSAVTSFFSSIWNGIKSAFSSVQSTLSGFFSGAWNSVKSAWSAATSYFSGIVNNIKSTFGTVTSTVGNAFKSAYTAVKSAWSGVTSFFSGIVTNIKSAFSGMVSSMSSIGKNIVQGLWNGISSMVSWITGKIKGFTDGVVSGFKSFFGIKSPSTVMRDQVGKYIGQGVGVGISEQADYIQRSLDDVMPTVPGLSGITSGMARGSSGQQPIYLQVDGQTFARLMTPYIDSQQGSAWSASMALG